MLTTSFLSQTLLDFLNSSKQYSLLLWSPASAVSCVPNIFEGPLSIVPSLNKVFTLMQYSSWDDPGLADITV